MALTNKQQRVFATHYKLITLLITRHVKGRELLTVLISNPHYLIPTELVKEWQPVQECLLKENVTSFNSPKLATVAAKAVLLFTDPKITAGASATYISIAFKNSTIDLNMLDLDSLDLEQWDRLHNLLSTIPQLTMLSIDLPLLGEPVMREKICAKLESIDLTTFRISPRHFSENESPLPLLHGLQNFPHLRKVSLNNNNLLLHNPTLWTCLSQIPNLTELDLSINLLGGSGPQSEINTFCRALKSMSKLSVLNVNNNNFGFYSSSWDDFCNAIGSMSRLRQVLVANNSLEVIPEDNWHSLYSAVESNPFLVIGGLPNNTPERLQVLNDQHRSWQRVILPAETMLEILDTPHSIEIVTKAEQALQALNLFLDETPLSLFSTEVRFYLKNMEEELRWSLTRALLNQFKQSDVNNPHGEVEVTLDPHYWLSFPPASPHYLSARIELFELLYLQQSSLSVRKNFLAALPALIDNKGELLNFGIWQTVFNRLLLQAVGVPGEMQPVLSDTLQLRYLQYLVLEDYCLHYPNIIDLSLAPSTTSTVSPNVTSTSAFFGSVTAVSRNFNLSDLLNLQNIQDPQLQPEIHRLWVQLVSHLNSTDMDETHRVRIAAITSLQQKYAFQQRYEQCITTKLSPLQAFINTLIYCLIEGDGTVYFNRDIDKLLLKAANLPEKLTTLTTELSIKVRIILLQYVLMLHLLQQEETPYHHLRPRIEALQPITLLNEIVELSISPDFFSSSTSFDLSALKNHFMQNEVGELWQEIITLPIPTELQRLFQYIDNMHVPPISSPALGYRA